MGESAEGRGGGGVSSKCNGVGCRDLCVRLLACLEESGSQIHTAGRVTPSPSIAQIVVVIHD